MNINKNVFLTALTCPAHAWHIRNGKLVEPPSVAARFRMEQGKEVHRRARNVVSGGQSAGLPAIDAAKRKTQELINDPTVGVIYEATFQVDHYVTRADILIRSDAGWELIEIKSSINDSRELTEDIAYTATVLLKAGLEVSSIIAMLLSKDYRLGMEDAELFVTIDKANDVFAAVENLASQWTLIDEITSQQEPPEHLLSLQCKNECPILAAELASAEPDHIFFIPRLHKTKALALRDERIVSMHEISEEFPLSDRQKLVVDTLKQGTPFVGADLGERLEEISWPAGYLDFESISTAIPLYEGIGPHTQMPFQYSLHSRSGIDAELFHHEFLADHNKDERRVLIEDLIKKSADLNSLVVYSGFEKQILTSLQGQFRDLEGAIQDLVNRLVDLEKIIKDSYYHLEFRGSTSIKKTLPVLVPELSYKNLGIQDGNIAMAEYYSLIRGKKDTDIIAKTRTNLLDYCKLDTLAMVRIHDALANLVS